MSRTCSFCSAGFQAGRGRGRSDPVGSILQPSASLGKPVWINTGLAPGRAGQGEARLGKAKQGWARQGRARRGELGEARHSNQEPALHAWFVLTFRLELSVKMFSGVSFEEGCG